MTAPNMAMWRLAVDDLVGRAMKPARVPLYMVVICTDTNVASALATAPAIARRKVASDETPCAHCPLLAETGPDA